MEECELKWVAVVLTLAAMEPLSVLVLWVLFIAVSLWEKLARLKTRKGYFPLNFGQTSTQLQLVLNVGWRRLKFKTTLQQLNKKARHWWFLKIWVILWLVELLKPGFLQIFPISTLPRGNVPQLPYTSFLSWPINTCTPPMGASLAQMGCLCHSGGMWAWVITAPSLMGH